MRAMARASIALLLCLVMLGTLGSFAEETGSSWLDGGGTALVEDLPDTDEEEEEEEPEQVVALYRTNILKAQNGMGTGRYTLAISTDAPLDETDPMIAAAAELTRRLIKLDGSLGDPADGSPLSDVESTSGIEGADVYAIMADSRSIFIYRNGEQLVSEQLSDHYRQIIYTRNLRGVPSLRYTRANGKTALVVFTPGCVVLFSGSYINLRVDYALSGMPVVFGSGCRIEELHVDSRILVHNSGLIEDSDYPPDGIDLIGVAVDEEDNPILIDSGVWTTGPRRVRGRLCKVCGREYNSKVESQYELHLVHACVWPDCKYGGFWASCAKAGGKYDPALHGPAPWCPYGICSTCSDIRCAQCQADIAAGRATARTP